LADSLKTVGGKVLIHCGAGISRSAAAALIM
jgi:protein-tyrosine phosphatase